MMVPSDRLTTPGPVMHGRNSAVARSTSPATTSSPKIPWIWILAARVSTCRMIPLTKVPCPATSPSTKSSGAHWVQVRIQRIGVQRPGPSILSSHLSVRACLAMPVSMTAIFTAWLSADARTDPVDWAGCCDGLRPYGAADRFSGVTQRRTLIDGRVDFCPAAAPVAPRNPLGIEMDFLFESSHPQQRDLAVESLECAVPWRN